MGIQITVPIDKIGELRQTFGDAVTEALFEAARRIKEELRFLTPNSQYSGKGLGKDPGGLARSFDVVPSATGITLSWSKSYAKYPDVGAPPHEMTPLHLKDPKSAYSTPYGFFKRIKHPGQAPQNYRATIAYAAIGIIKEELSKALIKVGRT